MGWLWRRFLKFCRSPFGRGMGSVLNIFPADPKRTIQEEYERTMADVERKVRQATGRKVPPR